ncbi:DUF3464 domain-containing protein [Aphanothece hegewaldii CCALA 016]|uniref:DUF3464 domain-containing protein n=1 Tax=Aphanothece hegewaldii CCALA 016 TaxID=2107694 RepID=A0A2T1LUN1_9CHRO|nr:PAM68 family protein [Aphanothece hegewaldii]PSF35264.1 DUF3464 domain-containing protein [Aphanothece hegewaldii CCALA 016]
MPSEPKRDRLPFEPSRNKKKTPKQPPDPVIAAKKEEASLKAIPEVVSQRMIKRMALFSGIPTALGMSSFFIFYLVVSRGWFKIPNYAVFAVSLGLFGLGVLGLSYGIFSTSWEENNTGSWLGWEEFKINFGRTLEAWRSGKKEANGNS